MSIRDYADRTTSVVKQLFAPGIRWATISVIGSLTALTISLGAAGFYLNRMNKAMDRLYQQDMAHIRELHQNMDQFYEQQMKEFEELRKARESRLGR